MREDSSIEFRSPLIETKIRPPRHSGSLVPRPRLLEFLTQGKLRKLTIVQAPAGFGKTALLLELRRALKIKGFGDPLLISEVLVKMAAKVSNAADKHKRDIRSILVDDNYFSKPISLPLPARPMLPVPIHATVLPKRRSISTSSERHAVSSWWRYRSGKFR